MEVRALEWGVLNLGSGSEETMENFSKGQLLGKGFDELYSEVVRKLRKDEKFIDLGERLRIAASDLSRVQLLVSDHPFVVRKFILGIEESYEGKSRVKSREFFLNSRKNGRGAADGIADLNNALRFHPDYGSGIRCPLPSRSELTMSERLTEDSLQWFLGIPVHEPNGIQTPIQGGSQLADESNDMDLVSKIYIERSRLFQEMGEHEACILDTFAAILLGLEKTFEIVYIVAINYKALGRSYYPFARSTFQHYVQLLRSSTLNNEIKSVLTLRVVKALKDIKSDESGSHETTPKTSNPIIASQVNRLSDVMEFYEGPSPSLIAASSAVELKFTPQMGRHAVATKRIPPGATLILDTPYSWSLFPQMYTKYCQNCCHRIRSRNWVPCQQCSTVVFCSEDCREKSEYYHKLECRILGLLDSSKILGEMALLSYRTIAVTPLSILVPFINHLEDEAGPGSGVKGTWSEKTVNPIILGLDMNGKLDPQNYSSVFAQTPNLEKRPSADLVKRTLAAVYLTLCFRFMGFFPPSNPEELAQEPTPPVGGEDHMSRLEIGIGALLLRHLQSASCNAYEMNSVSGEKNDPRHLAIAPIGGATYPTVSITNHSCSPNVYRFNIGKLSVVKAISEIPQGEQIFDSYGESFTTQSREERQKHLASQYFFECGCTSCKEDWPLYRDLLKSELQMRIPCPNCKAPQKKKIKKCSKCNRKIDSRHFLRDLKVSETNFASQKENLLSGTVITCDMVAAFSNHISLLQTLQSGPCPDKFIVECQEALKLAWNLSVC